MTAPDDDALIAQERVKYERMWTFEQYRGNRANVPQAERFMKMSRMAPGSVVLDVGCGPGYAARAFHDGGMRVIAVDIADNALEPETAAVVEFRQASVWALPDDLRADYGFCTDMMEHIPPDRIDVTLDALKRCVSGPVYFDISFRRDGCGRLIDDVLHLTIQPLEWWEGTLAAHWPYVEVVAVDYRYKSGVLLAGPRKV